MPISLLLSRSTQRLTGAGQQQPARPPACPLWPENREQSSQRCSCLSCRSRCRYDIGDLYSYIDQMPDLSALVFDPQLQAYVPYGKDWWVARAHLFFIYSFLPFLEVKF